MLSVSEYVSCCVFISVVGYRPCKCTCTVCKINLLILYPSLELCHQAQLGAPQGTIMCCTLCHFNPPFLMSSVATQITQY